MQAKEPSSKTLDAFFDGDEQARDLYAAVSEAVKNLREVTLSVGKSSDRVQTSPRVRRRLDA